MKRILSILCTSAFLLATGILFSASSLHVPSGTWIAAGSMNSVRSGASTVLLQDGRILVTGGNSANGPSSTAEFFGANASFSLATPMNVPRSQHVSVALQDGRILVAGGVTAGGSASSAAEIFDPMANSWTNVALGMMEARSGATADLLPDGRVVVAGGQNGTLISSTIEIFDPTLGVFAAAGMMSSPRTQHAMTVLQDGRVLIVGGNNGTAPVGSTDIFDPVAGIVSAGPNLSVARFGHSATRLLNGMVVVIGGNNGNVNPLQMDVTPAELFDPNASTPAFTTLASNLMTPREGHLAFLLPNNNNVLIVGGSSGGATVASAEVFTPQESSQGVWTYIFGSTGSMTTSRSSATGAPNQISSPSSVMQRNGVFLIAGGKDANGNALNSAEAYGFPTVQTDQSDYPPGTTVTITGSGWQPGETVAIQLVESPLIDTHGPYTVNANANGNISDSSFTTDLHDANVKFTLTAIGSVSRAQMTFTDSKPNSLTITTAASVAVAPGGTANYSLDLSFNGNAGPCSSPMSLAYTGSTPGGTTTTFTPASISGSTTTDGTGSLALATSGSTVPGSYPFTITASRGTCSQTGSATASGTLVVDAVPTFTSANNKTFTVGTAGSFSVTTTGGFPTPTLSESGSLPSGVTFTDNGNGTATLGGTPTVAGTFNLTFTAANSAGSPTQNFTLTVNKGTPTFSGLSVSQTISYGTPSISLSGKLNAGAGVVPSGTASITIDSAPLAQSSSLTGQVGSFTATVNTSSIAASATAYTITYSYAGDSNFNSATDTTTTLTVNKATLTASITGHPTKLYDGTTAATLTSANFSISGLVNSDSFTVTQTVGAYNSANVATAATVTASLTSGNFTAVGTTLASNYVLPTTASGAGQITAKTLTASITGNPSKAYDGTTAATLTSANFSISGLVNPDSFTVTQTVGAYNSANVATAATVTASLTSGNFTAVGTTLASNYVLPSTASGAGQITPKPVTASVTASNKTYDGTTSATITSCTIPGKVGSDDVACTVGSASFADKNAGNNKTVTAGSITLTGTTAGNYALSSTSSTTTANITALHITGSFTAHDKTYDGTKSATVVTETPNGVISPDAVTLIGGTATFADRNVGMGKTVTLTGASLSGADAPNYVLDSVATTTADITALHITGSFTAHNKTYDGTTSATVVTETPNGVISPDAVTLSGGTATFADKNVGMGKTVTLTGASLSGADTPNYVLDSVATTTANITALHITGSFTATDKVYNGNNSATVVTETPNGVISPDAVTLIGGTATFADKNVGMGKTVTLTGASLSGADAPNYVLDSVATTMANITALHITGSFTAHDKTYDGTTSATVLTETPNGVISPDAVTLSGGTATFADKNVGMGKTVTLTGASLSGADAPNYVLDSVATTMANITALHITGSFTAHNKTYDGTTSATVLTETPNGVISPDAVTLIGGTATFADKNVGMGKTVTLTGASLSGADAPNYVLDSVATTTADITALHITGSFTTHDKTYDGTTSATVVTETPNGVISPDAVTLIGGTATFADKNVGTSKTVTLTGASLSGADAPNYVLDSVATTTANITALHITGSFTTHDKTYDGTTSATVVTETPNGVISPDAVTLIGGTATFADKNVGMGKTVTLTGASLSGADAPNYVLDSVATTMADITTAAITATLTATNKIYDGSTTEPNANMSCTLNGVLPTDTVNCTATSGTFNTSQEATANLVTATVAISGTAAGNYTMGAAGTSVSSTSATATAHINPASTSTLVSSSANPSVFGQSATFTATVANTATSAIPTGSVQFVIDGVSSGSPLSLAGGMASISTSTLAVGTHTVLANFTNADGNFTNSSGSLTGGQVVNKASTTTAVSSSLNPSILNQPVTFTATVTVNAPGSGSPIAPAGNVTFTDTTTATTIGTAPLGTGGTAAITTSSLPVSAQNIVATYSGDGDFNGSSGSMVQKVTYQTGGLCDGDAGHQVLQPINASGTMSVFKLGSTVPTKFRVCDVNGVSIGTPGVVIGYGLIAVANSPTISVDEDSYSTTPDTAFRWDSTAQQWIFNQGTKNNPSLNATGVTYLFTVNLNDGTSIYFQYGLK